MRVMIVDDHEIVREGMRLMVGQVPWAVIVGEAATGAEAVAAAPELDPDVILMDVEMPGMSGIDAIRRLRDEMPEVRALVLTVHDGEEVIYDAVDAGAAGYLPKSSSADQIREALEALHAGGSYLPPDAAAKAMRTIVRRARSIVDASRGAASATPREREIIDLLCRGWSARRIAGRLGISERTVHTHIRRIYRRLKVKNRAEAVRESIRLGLVAP
ncbi:MAG TPA: response regulator transcription factor [Actinomycetota bacterium]|nr:response regulator transcription factor [Actinomycetota bacterium]